jgi:hypothetical protein
MSLEDRLLPSGSSPLQISITPNFVLPPKTGAAMPEPSGPLVVCVQRAVPAASSSVPFPRQPSAAAPQTIISGTGFAGVGLQDLYDQGIALIPPDTMGAVGPSHFVEMINGQFAVYTKSGSLVTSRTLTTFWSAVTPAGGTTDPHIVYDPHSSRWFVSTLDINNGRNNNDLLIGVSQSSDPTGSWSLYKVKAGSSAEFADYDTLGVDDNGVYFGMNMFPKSGGSHAAIFATAKAPLLSGSAITVFEFDGIPDMEASPQPAYNFDAVGSSDPAWFVASSTTVAQNIEYRTLTWSGGTPTLSATTTTLSTPVYGFTAPPTPSLGGTLPVDSGDDRLMMAVIRDHKLWTARTVAVNSSGKAVGADRLGAEFLELDVSTTTASLVQSGRAFDTAASNPYFYYYPSVMVNSQGYMVMGFSGSSATEYIGAYATGRLASDPAGQLQPVNLVKAGEGAYTITYGSGRNRWGDYSFTSLDPTDDQTIWTIQEYAAPTGTVLFGSASRWGTWINPLLAPRFETTTAISSSPNPSVFGQAVTFTATVSASGSPGTPSGTVDFQEGSTVLAGVTLDGTGVATFSTAGLSVGSHTITGSYGGDGSFQASSGDDATAPQVVNQAATTTAVKANVTPSVFGQPVTFTATIRVTAPGTGVPIGTVTFKDFSTVLGTGTLNSARQATFSTASLSRGNHAITASYSGDINFFSSTSIAYGQTVNRAATVNALTSTPNPAVFGQVVSFTAAVSASPPGAGTPTGFVTFKEGATVLGSGALQVAGVLDRATFSIKTLSVGSHTIMASYAGDGNFLASTGDDFSSPQTVAPDSTTTSVRVNVNPAVVGQAVTFTATVRAAAPGSGTPTGTATFMDFGSFLATTTLSGGQATFSTASLTRGNHAITASYSGDTNFTSSTSIAYGEPVNKGATTTLLSSSTNPSLASQLVTFTATVSVNSPAAGTPTGTVTFKEGSTVLGSGLLALVGDAAQATFTTAALSVGSHTLTAAYAGDNNFLASAGDDSASPQVVDPGSAAIASLLQGTKTTPAVAFSPHPLAASTTASTQAATAGLSAANVDQFFTSARKNGMSIPRAAARQKGPSAGHDWLSHIFAS